MNFLNPTAAIIAAALAVPALLLLYFLKLRRRYMRVASTLLWERAYEDLEVNAPFQRLHWSVLLLLQLLVLGALLTAMAQPVTEGEGRTSARLILVIDRSASMNATDGGESTRLDRTQEQAIDMVDRLGRGTVTNEVMVIAYGRTASVVTSFAHDRRQIIQAINSIEPTDEVGNLQAGLDLAAAFAGDSEDAGAQEADIVLFSDGNVGDPDANLGFRLRTGTFRFVRIGPEPGETVNNVGIASFSARRNFDDPSRVLVFARLVNTNPESIDAVLRLYVDDERAKLRRITVPGTNETSDDANDLPPVGEATVTFELELAGGAVLTLRHNIEDHLPGDDVAHLVMPAPAPPRIAIVHPGRGALPMVRRVLEDLEPASITPLSNDTFAQLDTERLDAGEVFDLIVFDRVSAERLPGVPSLTFGGAPSGVRAIDPERTGGRRILSWSRQHPVMRHVSLDSVLYRGFGHYELPQGAETLARGPDGPVIALLRTRGARHVMIGFPLDLDYTTWPLHHGLIVFLQNAQDHLLLTQSGQIGLVHQPGEPISVRPGAGVRELRIDGPVNRTVSAEPGNMRSLPALRRSGVYTVDGATPPWNQLAVSTLSSVESDIRPRETVIVNAEATGARRGDSIVPREYWPWLLAAAFVLLTLEWLEYCRRAR